MRNHKDVNQEVNRMANFLYKQLGEINNKLDSIVQAIDGIGFEYNGELMMSLYKFIKNHNCCTMDYINSKCIFISLASDRQRYIKELLSRGKIAIKDKCKPECGKCPCYYAISDK